MLTSIANFEVGVDPSGHPPLRFASAMLLRNDAQDMLASMIAAKTLCFSEQRFEFTGTHYDSVQDTKGRQVHGENVIVF